MKTSYIGQVAQVTCPLFVHHCHLSQTEKTLEKPVDKWGEKCYNMQAVNERDTAGTDEQKITKKVEKTFEKPLDKRKRL